MKKKLFGSMLLLLSLAAALIFCLSACREPEYPVCAWCQATAPETHYPYVAPTCTQEGRLEHWLCTACGNGRVRVEDKIRWLRKDNSVKIYPDGSDLCYDARYDLELQILPHEKIFDVTETEHSLISYQCGCPLEGEPIVGEHVLDENGYCAICCYQQGTPGILYELEPYRPYAYVVGFEEGFSSSVVKIASHYKGCEVIEIGPRAGKSLPPTQVEMLVIPHTVETICHDAFSGFTELKHVSFAPNSSLIVLEARSFAGCTALTAIQIPANARYLSNEYWDRSGGGCCVDGVIDESPFIGCTALKEISFEAGSRLKELSLNGCTALRSVTVPESVERVSFTDCAALESIAIPANVNELRKNCFSGCSALSSITLSEGLKSIDKRVFANCTALTAISIPDSVKSIGKEAFYNCTALTAIFIPDSVESIGKEAFCNCTALRTLRMPPMLFEKAQSILVNCTALEEVTVPEGTRRITGNLFSGCVNLKHIRLPEGLESIGAYAFQGCTSLAEVNWPQTLTTIGQYAFSNTALTALELPQSVTLVYTNAFMNCKALRSVVLPNEMVELGIAAFAGCSALESVRLPEALEYIGSDTFRGCIALKNVTMPKTLIGIGTCAFCNCAALTAVTLPASLKSIDKEAFYDCYSLKSVSFEAPDGWYCGETKEPLAATDPAEWATYLRSEYVGHAWFKES